MTVQSPNSSVQWFSSSAGGTEQNSASSGPAFSPLILLICLFAGTPWPPRPPRTPWCPRFPGQCDGRGDLGFLCKSLFRQLADGSEGKEELSFHVPEPEGHLHYHGMEGR